LGATLFHLLTGQRPKPITMSAPKSIEPKVLPSLDALVQRLTSHNIDERPTSARQVRYELYAIYQEIHPEFDIPDEALVSLTMSNNDARNSKILPRRGVTSDTASWREGLSETDPNDTLKVVSAEELRVLSSGRLEKTQLRKNVEPSVGVRRRNDQPASLWQRVKEWWTINFQ
jgi:serine/threonine protein kinase